MKDATMPHEDDADEYDWRSVEQQLASMRQKRIGRQRFTTDTSHTVNSKSPSTTLCMAGDFELEAVEDSDSSGSDSDQSSGHRDHGSDRRAQPFAHKRASKRLKDSLDLSMSESVADLRPCLPRERRQAAQLISKTTVIPAPISPIAPPATCADVINPSSLLHPSSSALIQRRRQLEQEATKASAKDESNQTRATDVDCGKVTLETSASNASRLQTRIVQPTISRLLRVNEPRAQTDVTLTAQTHSDVEPKTQSPLVRPSAIPARTREELKKPFERTAPITSNQEQTAIPTHSAIPTSSIRLSTKPTTAVPVVPSSKPRNKVPNRLEPEDDQVGLDSEEEAKLLRSLESLDTRLTQLAVKPTKKSGYGNQNPRSNNRGGHADRPNGSGQSGPKRMDTPQEDFTPDDDEELVRRAAYGGGTHHRSLQQTSPSVRTSCLKRTEISGGLPRARVRPGAPQASETINRDADGRHKIVVKKDLAHLLFFN